MFWSLEILVKRAIGFAYVYFVENDKKFSLAFLRKKQAIANSDAIEKTESNIEETVFIETSDDQTSTEENN